MAIRRKRFAPSIRMVSANLRHGMTQKQAERDLRAILRRNPNVIGFQEVSGQRARIFKRILAQAGYGFAMAHGVPIAYNTKTFKMVASGKRFMTPTTNVGEAGAGPAVQHRKDANWVVLQHRRTGSRAAFTNAHLVPSIHLGGKRAELHRRQIRALAQLQQDLAKRYPHAARVLMGDMNTSQATRFALIRRTGMVTYRAPRRTHQAGFIDWFATDALLSGKTVFDLESDHHAYMATLGRGGVAPKGGGSGGLRLGSGSGGSEVALSAYELFADLLESWGVPVGADIEKIVKAAVIEGITPNMMQLVLPEIQATASWKKRFPGWHERVSKGYNQLTVDEYLTLEDTYHRILQEAGLPKGFYDDPSDFGNWIANDVSPQEIQGRVNLAMDAVRQVDPTARDLLTKFYGVTSGDLASYFLDQKRALPVLDRQFKSANVAAWAARHGLQVDNAKRYESLVDQGVTAEMAAQGYGTVAAFNRAFGQLAGVYGESYSQTDAEEDVFFNKNEKRRALLNRERGTFSGASRGMTGTADRGTSY